MNYQVPKTVSIPKKIVPTGIYKGKPLRFAVFDAPAHYLDFLMEKGKHPIYSEILHWKSELIKFHGPHLMGTHAFGLVKILFKDGSVFFFDTVTGDMVIPNPLHPMIQRCGGYEINHNQDEEEE